MTVCKKIYFITMVCLFYSCDEKVERCEKNDASPEECAEFRIIETPDEVTYSLGSEITIRSDKGTFSSSDKIDLEFLSTDSLETCGGELVSKAILFKALDRNDEVIEREDIKNKLLYIRMDSNAVVENRDTTLFAIILRGGAGGEAFYVSSEKYKPNGSSAIEKTDVNFYSDETYAGFYLVEASDGVENCAVYQTLAEEEASEEEE